MKEELIYLALAILFTGMWLSAEHRRNLFASLDFKPKFNPITEFIALIGGNVGAVIFWLLFYHKTHHP